MQDSPTALILIAVLLSLLHTVIAAYLLMRNAERIANWQISPYKAMVGQFAVFVGALAVAAGFVAVNLVASLLNFAGLFIVTPVLFLLLYWVGQDRMIAYLSVYRGRRRVRNLMRRRIGFLTILPTFFICLGLVATGFIYYALKPAQPEEKPIREVSRIDVTYQHCV